MPVRITATVRVKMRVILWWMLTFTQRSHILMIVQVLRLGFIQLIAVSADRLDHAARRAQFLPQTLDVRVHRPCRDIGIELPNFFQQPVPGLNAPFRADERDQQLELHCRQSDFLAVNGHFTARDIDLDWAEIENFLHGLFRFPTVEDSLYAQDKLSGAERLHDIVVRPKLETDDAVDFFPLGGEHDDRYDGQPPVLLDALAGLQAVHFREHDIQDDQIDRLCIQNLQRVLPRNRGLTGIPGFFQVIPDKLGNVLVVLNNKYPLLGHCSFPSVSGSSYHEPQHFTNK